MEINARIRMIIDSHRLTAGAFADKIGVQRSNVSHVLSGRNKPSFEFLEKVLLAFPKVSALWLITGLQGRDQEVTNQAVKDEKPIVNKARSTPDDEVKSNHAKRKLVKTILFYDDMTCEEFTVSMQQ